jgi:hypothetical protein
LPLSKVPSVTLICVPTLMPVVFVAGLTMHFSVVSLSTSGLVQYTSSAHEVVREQIFTPASANVAVWKKPSSAAQGAPKRFPRCSGAG